jgi:hypothetical protein
MLVVASGHPPEVIATDPGVMWILAITLPLCIRARDSSELGKRAPANSDQLLIAAEETEKPG